MTMRNYTRSGITRDTQARNKFRDVRFLLYIRDRDAMIIVTSSRSSVNSL